MSDQQNRSAMTDRPTRTINYACPGGCGRRLTATIYYGAVYDPTALTECQECYDRRFAVRLTFWQRFKKAVGW